MHPTWVAHSVKARKMLPMYEYVEETQEHALGLLSPEQRDLAEMMKAMSQPSFKVFETLHHKVRQALYLLLHLVSDWFSTAAS